MEEQINQSVPEKKSKWWIWIIAILVLAIVGVGIYFLFFNGGSGSASSIVGSGNSIPQPPALPE